MNKQAVTIKSNRHEIPILKKSMSKNTGIKFKAKNDLFDVSFQSVEAGGGLIIFSDGKYKIKFMPIINDNEIKVSKLREVVTYKDIFDGADLRYLLNERGIKEEIVIREVKEKYEYKFKLVIDNLFIDLKEDGRCFFNDTKTNRSVFEMSKLIMFDAKQMTSENIVVSVDEDLVMTFTCDSAWINSKQRKFPITVDPQVEVIDKEPISMHSSNSTNTRINEVNGQIDVGYKNIGSTYEVKNNLKIKINTSNFIRLIDNEKVFNIKLKITLGNVIDELVEGMSRCVLKHNGKVITYIDSYSNKTYEIDITEELRLHMFKNVEPYMTFDLEYCAQDYQVINKEESKKRNEYVRVYTPNAENEDYAPSLLLKYDDGGTSKESAENVVLNNKRSGTFELNSFDGSYLHHHHDATISSGPLKVELKHVYDTNFLTTELGSSNSYGLGKGWRTNLHQTLHKSDYPVSMSEGRKVTYTDGDGKKHFLYEKWYYEVNGEKIYDGVERNKIYLDNDNKLKIEINNVVHEVKFEVKNDEGLQLLTSSSMVSYLDKSKFKLKRTFQLEYANGVFKTLVYNEKIKRLVIPVKEAEGISENIPNWLYAPFLNGTEMPWQAIDKHTYTNYDMPKYTLYSSCNSSVELPLKFDGKNYYINFSTKKTISDIIMLHGDSNSNKTSGQSVMIRGKQEVTVIENYFLDDSVTPLEFILTEDIQNIETQISFYNQQLEESKLNLKILSEKCDEIEDLKVKYFKDAVRNRYSQLMNRESISDSKQKRNNIYDTHTIISEILSAWRKMSPQISEILVNIEKIDNKYLEYKRIISNLEEKRGYIIQNQKNEANDFIIDNSGSILSFDYYGKLINIQDRYENVIEIKYKENTFQLIEVISKNGKTTLNYSKNGNLNYILDESGRKTNYIYNLNKELIKIEYDKLLINKKSSEFFYDKNNLVKIVDNSLAETIDNNIEITVFATTINNSTIDMSNKFKVLSSNNTFYLTNIDGNPEIELPKEEDIISIYYGVSFENSDKNVDYNGAVKFGNIIDKKSNVKLFSMDFYTDLRTSVVGNEYEYRLGFYDKYDDSDYEEHIYEKDINPRNNKLIFSFQNVIATKIVDNIQSIIEVDRKAVGKTIVKQSLLRTKNDIVEPEKIIVNAELIYSNNRARMTSLLDNNRYIDYSYDYKLRTTDVIEHIYDEVVTSYYRYNEKSVESSLTASSKGFISKVDLPSIVQANNEYSFEFLSHDIKNKLKSDQVMLVIYFDEGTDFNGLVATLMMRVKNIDSTDDRELIVSDINQRLVAISIPINKEKFTHLWIEVKFNKAIRIFKAEIFSSYGSEYYYDKNEKLKETIDGFSATKYLDHIENNPTRIINIDKFNELRETKLLYNDNHQNTYSENNDGDVFETYYDEKGHIIESSSYNKYAASDKKITRTSYDETGNAVSYDGILPSKDGVIRNTEYRYLPNTDVISSIKNPNELIMSYGYDFNTGNLLEFSAEVDGYNNKNTFKYNQEMLTSLTHNGFEIRYELDSLGRKTAIFIGNNELMKISYHDLFPIEEKLGSKVITTHPNGITVELLKDYEGKVLSIKTFDEGILKEDIVSSYDKYGKLISEINTIKNTDQTIIEYDLDDRVKKQTTTFDGNDEITETYSYDEKGRLSERYLDYSDFGEYMHYGYDDKNNLILSRLDDKLVENYYDALNRIEKKKYTLNQLQNIEEFSYYKAGDQTTDLIKKHVYKIGDNNQYNTNYEYDESANITKITTDDFDTKYQYDKIGRLIREDNEHLNLSMTYEYDNGGNILNKKVYEYSKNELNNKIESNKYIYSDSWKDQLTSFNGKNIKYDIMGNPIIYKDETLKWSKTGQLLSYGNNKYEYNKQGIRVKKTVNGIETKIYTLGTKVLGMKYNNKDMYFMELNDSPIVFEAGTYNGYFYKKNIQGDIVSIHDYTDNGKLIAEYVYDAWGNHIVLDDSGCENTDPNFIGNINPLRYRGYYYDVETNLYYLNSRYYDPETGRFISADTLSILDEAMMDINGINLYAYCDNNPVMNIDPNGYSWNSFWNSTFGKVLGTMLIVGAVITLSVLTAGIGTAVTAAIGGFWGATLGGAVGGAISGAILSAGIATAGQGIKNGYANIDWGVVGISTLAGAASGFILGGALGGIRYARAFKHLTSSGKTARDAKDIISTFKGTPRLKTVKSGTRAFRVYGGTSEPIGNWISPKIYSNPVQRFALNPAWGNDASKLAHVLITQNTKVLVGRAAAHGMLRGGGLQWFIDMGVLFLL